tara:strand:- start:17 stop:334 length:318 start_codon:yes stop_codon:yes gene_type:complete
MSDTEAQSAPKTRRKIWRHPKVKPGQLIAYYGKLDGSLDIIYNWGGGGATKCDSHLVHNMFSGLEHRKYGAIRCEHDGYLKELEARGYDLTTLKFSIQRKPEAAK